MVIASVGAVLALRAGPVAALALGAGAGAVFWRLRGRIELVSDRWPRPVPVPPPGPPLDLPPLDEIPDLPPPTAPSEPPPTLLDLVTLPGGRFWMGTDPTEDPQAYQDEQPRHEVTLAPFRIARTPVTRGQWRAVMATAPAPWRRDVPSEWAVRGRDDLPTTWVTWFDALAFCNALSLAEGLTPCYAQRGDDWTCDWQADGYRLPTEAEWEYACRGGRQTPWFWGRWGFVARWCAWYAEDARGRVHPVGQKRPNPFGLHDLTGNCWEWCWDWYGAYQAAPIDDPRGPATGGQRVLRGGSFVSEPRVLRSARRVGAAPELRSEVIGFRCVRSGAPALDNLIPFVPFLVTPGFPRHLCRAGHSPPVPRGAFAPPGTFSWPRARAHGRRHQTCGTGRMPRPAQMQFVVVVVVVIEVEIPCRAGHRPLGAERLAKRDLCRAGHSPRPEPLPGRAPARAAGVVKRAGRGA